MLEEKKYMDFMNNLNSMLVGESKEVRERRQLIEQKEKTRQNLLVSVDSDISGKNLEINFVYQKIGKSVFEKVQETEQSSIDTENLLNEFEELKEKLEELAILNTKKAEIDARYSEELEMLKKLLPQPQNAPSDETGQICQKCGKLRTKNELFCTACGNKY